MLQWQIGAPCCAVYSGDGVIYEATIAALFHDRGTCLLRYVGKWKVCAHIWPPCFDIHQQKDNSFFGCLVFIFEIHYFKRVIFSLVSVSKSLTLI
jgi:hypothetical protein